MAHRDYLHKWEQDSENGKTLMVSIFNPSHRVLIELNDTFRGARFDGEANAQRYNR